MKHCMCQGCANQHLRLRALLSFLGMWLRRPAPSTTTTFGATPTPLPTAKSMPPMPQFARTASTRTSTRPGRLHPLDRHNKATCEEFPHPEVSECAAAGMSGLLRTLRTPASPFLDVSTCRMLTPRRPESAHRRVVPHGGQTHAVLMEMETQPLLTSARTSPCLSGRERGGQPTACQAQSGCVYTPDDAATPENEQTCLIRDEAACEHELLSIQNEQQTVSGKGLFVTSGGTGTIDVGDTITVVQALGSTGLS